MTSRRCRANGISPPGGRGVVPPRGEDRLLGWLRVYQHGSGVQTVEVLPRRSPPMARRVRTSGGRRASCSSTTRRRNHATCTHRSTSGSPADRAPTQSQARGSGPVNRNRSSGSGCRLAPFGRWLPHVRSRCPAGGRCAPTTPRPGRCSRSRFRHAGRPVPPDGSD